MRVIGHGNAADFVREGRGGGGEGSSSGPGLSLFNPKIKINAKKGAGSCFLRVQAGDGRCVCVFYAVGFSQCVIAGSEAHEAI